MNILNFIYFILMLIIRFLLTLIFFPFVWILLGIYVYLRVLFTLDDYSISFYNDNEFTDFEDIKDKK
jgi:hypothetical protein